MVDLSVDGIKRNQAVEINQLLKIVLNKELKNFAQAQLAWLVNGVCLTWPSRKLASIACQAR